MRVVYTLGAAMVALIVVLGYFTFRDASDGAGGAARLVIVSPHPETVLQEFERAFSAKHEQETGRPVRIDWEDHGGTSSIVRYITSEFSASPEGVGIDVFWGGGFEPYVKLADEGRLEARGMRDDILENLPGDLGGIPMRDSEHRWYGTALSSFGIMYNKLRLDSLGLESPRSWEDLAKPEMLGEVGAADPRRSGSAHMCYEIILQALGWEEGWATLVRMAANSRNFYEGANDIPRNVSLAQVATGAVIDFYAWNQIRIDGADKIGFVLPSPLTVLTPDAIGVLKGAPNEELAFRFVEFVLSEEGQKLWFLRLGASGGPTRNELERIPMRADVYRTHQDHTNVKFDPSAFDTDFVFRPEVDSRRRAALKDFYGATLIDTHPELVAAWRGVIDRGLRPAEVAELCKPLVSEEELARMSEERWSDPTFRNRMIMEWSNEARQRYNRLARGI